MSLKNLNIVSLKEPIFRFFAIFCNFQHTNFEHTETSMTENFRLNKEVLHAIINLYISFLVENNNFQSCRQICGSLKKKTYI